MGSWVWWFIPCYEPWQQNQHTRRPFRLFEVQMRQCTLFYPNAEKIAPSGLPTLCVVEPCSSQRCTSPLFLLPFNLDCPRPLLKTTVLAPIILVISFQPKKSTTNFINPEFAMAAGLETLSPKQDSQLNARSLTLSF